MSLSHLLVPVLVVVCLASLGLGAVALAEDVDVNVVQHGRVTLEVSRSTTYDYFVKLPAGYNESTQLWPMILHLHGSGSSLSGVKESTEAFDRPFVLVQPRSPVLRAPGLTPICARRSGPACPAPQP